MTKGSNFQGLQGFEKSDMAVAGAGLQALGRVSRFLFGSTGARCLLSRLAFSCTPTTKLITGKVAPFMA